MKWCSDCITRITCVPGKSREFQIKPGNTREIQSMPGKCFIPVNISTNTIVLKLFSGFSFKPQSGDSI